MNAPTPRKSFSTVNPKLQIAFDSVSMGALKKCARYYQLTIVEGWRPKRESHHLRYGQLYHRALEVYDHKVFEGAGHEDALRAALRDLAEGCTDTTLIDCAECGGSGFSTPGSGYNNVCDRCGGQKQEQIRSWWDPFAHLDEEKAAKETKSVPNLFRTVIWYLDQFGMKDECKTIRLANGKPAVELSFRYELGYTFKHVCPDCEGTGMLGDFKCPRCDGTGQLEEELLHSGHLDRLVALGEAHYFLDRKTSKNTINGNSAWGYFAQFSPSNQMTGYYHAGKIALAVPIVGGIIDAAQVAKGFSRFERGFITRTDAQLDEWRTDFIQYAKLAEAYAEQNYWPMNDTACDHYGGCPLRGICNKDPKVRHIFLQSDFVKRPWDPLEVRGDI